MKQYFCLLLLALVMLFTACIPKIPDPLKQTGNTSQNVPQNIDQHMITLTTYLLLDGNCRPAMEFYQSVFGGDLSITKVGETSIKSMMPASMQDRVVNARLISGHIDLSASDWLRPGQKPIQGNTVCLYLSGGSFSELKTLYDRLSDGAVITDSLKQEFHGTYGALNDKFGIRWMFQTSQN